MRYIKRYRTEDDFAQMENNSGYPANAVTSIKPGMAFVVEDRNVYYNEKPIPPTPPAPEFTRMQCFSGSAEIQFSGQDPVSYRTSLAFKGDASAITGWDIILTETSEGSSPWTINDVGSGPLTETISIEPGDIYFFEYNDGMVLVPYKLYTLNETAQITGSDAATFKIFYYSGGGETRTFYAATSRENSSFSGSYSDVFMNYGQPFLFEYFVVEEPGPSWQNLQVCDWGAFLCEFEDAPHEFPYIQAGKIKSHEEYDGETWEECYAGNGSFINVEPVSGNTYQLTNIHGYDVSANNYFITPDEYYAIEFQGDKEGGSSDGPSFGEIIKLNKNGEVRTYQNDQEITVYQPFSFEGSDTPLFGICARSWNYGGGDIYIEKYIPSDGVLYVANNGVDLSEGYNEVAALVCLPIANPLPECEDISLDDVPVVDDSEES